MSNTDYILNLLDITDENIKPYEVYNTFIKNIRTKIIKAKLSYKPGRCPDCGLCAQIKNGFKEVTYDINSLNGIPYRLRLFKQRFYCKNCHSSHFARSPFLNFNSIFTQDIIERIIQLAQDSLTLKEIAKLVGASPSSVNRILYKNSHYHWHHKPLPHNLSFDEFSIKKNEYAFIGIDADTHKQLVLLPDRKKKTIIEFFLNQYSLYERQQVETVTVDMNADYATYAHQLFPNAEIIIDRFHIIQLIQRTLTDARILTVKQTEDHHNRTYKALKTHWRLFNKSETLLDAQHIKYYRGLNEYTTQQNIVDLGLQYNPEFSRVYQAYQTILNAVQTKNFQAIEHLLDTYTPSNSPLDVTIRTLKRNRHYIKNALEYPFSNGPIEGLNRKIKTLKRNCYGFKNVQHFFTRIQLILG
ncbi:ISL3 family transposase [Latilactobacillus curvatus]|uniref:ISL3 family transposase n=1 Tax=Latilactobacillus curvatus TaxID=28038 RepID=UPI0020C7AA2F|nr:ISL3 family transposase [Latilactobacillus curvatus]MCP8860251.1 ISL3 family transposase [Latilactobacillus curvatus]